MVPEDFYKYLVQPELMNGESLLQFRELVEKEPAFQSAWILYLKNLMMLNDPALTNELRRASIYIQDRKKLYMFLHQQTEQEYMELFESDEMEKKQEDILEIDYAANIAYELESNEEENGSLSDLVDSFRKKTVTKKKQSLVDKFLKNEPLLELDEGPDEPEGSERGSKDDDFISETLANIYARQSYYDKAIEVFEKLSLKYPEKNIYFAGRIEEIKKLKNN